MNLGLESLMYDQYLDASTEELTLEYFSASRELATAVREIQHDLDTLENLLSIGRYLNNYGSNEAFRTLIDDHGELSAIIGSDYSLERLDDAITGFFAKIGEKIGWVLGKLGHKISTWFPTINRYETMFNNGVRAIQGHKIDESVLQETVRGINAGKLNDVVKYRKESLDLLKDAYTMVDGSIDKLLDKLNENPKHIARWGAAIFYKKDTLFHKLFLKEKLTTLGYSSVSQLNGVISFGKTMFDLYEQYNNTGKSFVGAWQKTSSSLQRLLNAGDQENARTMHKKLSTLNSWFIHVNSFHCTAMDQMVDEAAFAGYTAKKMAKHVI